MCIQVFQDWGSCTSIKNFGTFEQKSLAITLPLGIRLFRLISVALVSLS